MTPNERIAAIAALREQIKSHPMCADFSEDDAGILVIYPPGYQLDGAQVSKRGGVAVAMQRLLSAMERHWLESLPGGVPAK